MLRDKEETAEWREYFDDVIHFLRRVFVPAWDHLTRGYDPSFGFGRFHFRQTLGSLFLGPLFLFPPPTHEEVKKGLKTMKREDLWFRTWSFVTRSIYDVSATHGPQSTVYWEMMQLSYFCLHQFFFLFGRSGKKASSTNLLPSAVSQIEYWMPLHCLSPFLLFLFFVGLYFIFSCFFFCFSRLLDLPWSRFPEMLRRDRESGGADDESCYWLSFLLFLANVVSISFVLWLFHKPAPTLHHNDVPFHKREDRVASFFLWSIQIRWENGRNRCLSRSGERKWQRNKRRREKNKRWGNNFCSSSILAARTVLGLLQRRKMILRHQPSDLYDK